LDAALETIQYWYSLDVGAAGRFESRENPIRWTQVEVFTSSPSIARIDNCFPLYLYSFFSVKCLLKIVHCFKTGCSIIPKAFIHGLILRPSKAVAYKVAQKKEEEGM
jgi:hypothetical protein